MPVRNAFWAILLAIPSMGGAITSGEIVVTGVTNPPDLWTIDLTSNDVSVRYSAGFGSLEGGCIWDCPGIVSLVAVTPQASFLVYDETVDGLAPPYHLYIGSSMILEADPVKVDAPGTFETPFTAVGRMRFFGPGVFPYNIVTIPMSGQGLLTFVVEHYPPGYFVDPDAQNTKLRITRLDYVFTPEPESGALTAAALAAVLGMVAGVRVRKRSGGPAPRVSAAVSNDLG